MLVRTLKRLPIGSIIGAQWGQGWCQNVNKETTKAFVRLFANGIYIKLFDFIASRAPIVRREREKKSRSIVAQNIIVKVFYELLWWSFDSANGNLKNVTWKSPTMMSAFRDRKASKAQNVPY